MLGRTGGQEIRQLMFEASSPPPSTENPRHDARMGHSGHAPPAWEPAAPVPRHGAPGTMPGRAGVRRARASMTASRLCCVRPAPGVAVIDPVRSGRPATRAARRPPGPGLGCGPRAARHAQGQGTALSIRQDADLGAAAVPAAAREQDRLFVETRPIVLSHNTAGQIRVGLPVGHPARPDVPVPPFGLAVIDRIPLPVSVRPPTPGGAPRTALPRIDGHALHCPHT